MSLAGETASRRAIHFLQHLRKASQAMNANYRYLVRCRRGHRERARTDLLPERPQVFQNRRQQLTDGRVDTHVALELRVWGFCIYGVD
jgi:hypothetical protein